MFDQQDEELGPILTLVLGIAIVISLFAIAVALSVAGVFSGSTATTTAESTEATSGLVEAGATVGAIKVYFEIGSSALSPSAAGSLFPAVVAMTVDPKQHIELSGYHDASGDRAQNEELAKARAIAVRDALVASGVSEDRIELHKPVEVLGGDDPKEARRVDVELR